MKIPPLNPLKVFEVVARTRNLTQAAVELRVSQSAVSRQIGVLERYLGVPLFTRERIGVKLTAVGEYYARRVGPAFEAISDATQFVTRKYSDNRILLRTYTTLTARWLIPRLRGFNARFPDYRVEIINNTEPVDFGAEKSDLAIVFGDGQWPGVNATLLLDDVIEPVCSPDFLEAAGGNEALLDQLGEQRLLVSRYRKNDWLLWLATSGLEVSFDRCETMHFSSSVLTWQAAVDGLGIAIGQQHLLERDFAAGRLVRPFARPLRTERGHYIVTPSVQRFSTKIATLHDWLLQEANAPH